MSSRAQQEIDMHYRSLTKKTMWCMACIWPLQTPVQ